MTNLIVTNFVIIANTNPVVVTMMDWQTQSAYFLSGLSYGLPLALALAVFYAIVKALKPTPFPSAND